MDRIEALLESTESGLRIIDNPLMPKPSTLCGSALTPDAPPATTSSPPPKLERTKQTVPPGGIHPSYLPSRPKWDDITNRSKAQKFCCACFYAHTHAQVCFPLANAGLVINNETKFAQRVIDTYTKNKKT